MKNKFLNLMNSLNMILILTEIAYHLKNKKIFGKLVKDRTSEFSGIKDKIHLNKLT